MSEKTIVERLRELVPRNTTPSVYGIALDEAADLLEAFFEQMQLHSPQMNGQHSWRLRGSGWPMTHCKGPTREDAMRAMVAEIKREREAQEAK